MREAALRVGRQHYWYITTPLSTLGEWCLARFAVHSDSGLIAQICIMRLPMIQIVRCGGLRTADFEHHVVKQIELAAWEACGLKSSRLCAGVDGRSRWQKAAGSE